MKIKQAACLAAAAVAFSAPMLAQAQGQGQSSSGAGAGASPGTSAPPAGVVIAEVDVAGIAEAPPHRVLPGSVVALADSQTWVDGNQRTTVNTYWVNVPPHVANNHNFQRWQHLQ